MTDRPVIGVPTQTQEAIPNQLPRSWVMGQRYILVLSSVGAVPWLIPALKDEPETLRGIYERLDGLFLPGGVDIDPTNYGEECHELCGRSDPARDWTEIMLIRWALEDRKPILAVCRGIQSVNVAAGGTLYQDLGAQRPDGIKHDYLPAAGGYPRNLLVHTVRVAEHSRLARILGVREARVNSMHHQGVKDLAPGLVPSAVAPDGLIEGVEAPDRFLVAVQWHPEELTDTDAGMRGLFSALIAAAREFRYGRAAGRSACSVSPSGSRLA